MKVIWTTYPNGFDETKHVYKFSLVASVGFEENSNKSIRQFQKKYFEMLTSDARPVILQLQRGSALRQVAVPMTTRLNKRAAMEKFWNYLFVAAHDEAGINPQGAQAPLNKPTLRFSDFHADFFASGTSGGIGALSADAKGTLVDEMLNYYSLFTDTKPSGFGPMAVPDDEVLTRVSTSIKNFSRKFNQRVDRYKSIYEPEKSGISPLAATEIKYYHVISKLFEYPDILRMLGLIIDFEIAQNDIESDLPEAYRTLIPTAGIDWLDNEPDDTRFPFAVFSNSIAGDKGTHGIKNCGALEALTLKPNEHYLLQFEPDEYLASIVQQGDRVQREAERQAARNEQNRSNLRVTPVLTKGFSLFMKERSSQEQTAMQGNPVKLLTAINASIGYRVDVEVKIGTQTTLHSLTSQDVQYEATNLDDFEGTFSGEGWITTDAAMKSQSAANEEHYQLSNKLFTWDGFSLACPYPLPRLGPDKLEGKDGEVDASVKYLSEKIQLKKSATENSILPLRFDPTRQYAFRLRSVLPNGYSLSTAQGAQVTKNANSNSTTALQSFLRQEVVQPPLFVLNNKLIKSQMEGGREISRYPVRYLEGESLDTLVIRNYNDSSQTTQEAIRHIIPPQVSFQLAEWHGKFDKYYRNGRAKLIRKLYHASMAEVPVVIDPQNDDAQFEEYFLQQSGFLETKKFDTLYLPDPACQGFFIRCKGVRRVPRSLQAKLSSIIALYTLRLQDEKRLKFDLFDYPKFQPWTLHLKETSKTMEEALNDGKPLYSISEDQNRIVYFLPKGYEIDFEIECTTTLQQGTFAVRKEHLFVPKKFTLVHAVQIPLTQPRLINYELEREADRSKKTIVRLKTKDLAYDELSTESLELYAQWDEYSDARLPEVDPEKPNTNSRLEHANILENEVLIEQLDTRFRPKKFYLQSVSRFKEYYTNSNSVYADAMKDLKFTKAGPAHQVDLDSPFGKMVLNNEKPSAPEIAYIIPVLRWTQDQVGGRDVRIRSGNRLRMFFRRGSMFDSGGEVQIAIKIKSATNTREYSRIGQDVAVERVRENGNDDSANFQWVGKPVKDGTEDIAIMTYKPRFSHEQDLWYIDIDIPNTQYYFPFVQFYVAKYQRYSAKDEYAFSNFVRSDFSQFFPDRRFFKSQTNGLVQVGFAVKRTNNESLPHRQKNMLTITLEARKARSGTNELLWTPKDERQINDVFKAALDESVRIDDFQYVILKNPISQPDDYQPGDEYRIVVEEYERYVSRGSNESDFVYNERLVYMDIASIDFNQ